MSHKLADYWNTRSLGRPERYLVDAPMTIVRFYDVCIEKDPGCKEYTRDIYEAFLLWTKESMTHRKVKYHYPRFTRHLWRMLPWASGIRIDNKLSLIHI